jgi:hypothetical protein
MELYAFSIVVEMSAQSSILDSAMICNPSHATYVLYWTETIVHDWEQRTCTCADRQLEPITRIVQLQIIGKTKLHAMQCWNHDSFNIQRQQ